MKNLLKKIVIIWVVICILLSTICSNFVLAVQEGYINSERAGNYVANFAINFYENWSSLTPVESSKFDVKFTNYGSGNFAVPLNEGDYSTSSPFGWRDLGGKRELHSGTDYSAASGTAVYSSSNGKVVQVDNSCTHNYGKEPWQFCGCGGGYGRNIKIDTGNGIGIVYAHLTDILVKEGETVKQGQKIATVGSTGDSTGAHLHFEFLTNNIEGIQEGQYRDRGTPGLIGFRYSVAPELYLGKKVASGSMGVLAAGQKIYDDILLGNTKIAYVAKGGRDAEQIVNNKSYSESEGMDCSTFVSAAIWLSGYNDFKSTTNTYGLEDGCLDGSFVKKYGWKIYKTDRSSQVYQLDENGKEHLISNVKAEDFMQPGDIIVVNYPDRGNGHTNIVKTVQKDKSNKYVALDCGSSDNWQNVGAYNSNGGGLQFDIWSNHNNWDTYYHGTDRAFLIRTGSNIASDLSNSKVKIRGEIKTEYDDEIDPTADIDPETKDNYKFNNLSWIAFAYRQSIYKKDVNKILDGNLKINTENFNTKLEIEKVKDSASESDIINIPQLISEGKILPGDILYAENGNGSGEYLLYVGGAKVIYATGDEKVGPSGALKYEYIQYYLRRIKNRLLQGHEEDQSYIIPKYGITQVYRIKQNIAEGIKENDTNLIFNGKGYYNISDYEGIASEVSLNETQLHLFRWIFSAIVKLLEFLVNLIFYMVRMQIIGLTNLVENLIQHVVLGLSGDNSSSSTWEGIFGTSGTSASGDRITVESIFFNQIPILDANFFNFETAGGHSLTIEKEQVTETGETTTVFVPDDHNVVYLLRRNLRTMYMVVRNLSMALLLFVLVVLGIKLAITASAEKKAEYKKLLFSWIVAMAIVIFIHLFMYTIFAINDTFVEMCKDWGQTASNTEINDLIKQSQSQEEMNLYDAIRIKAYAFSWKEGIPATILYVFLVYLMIRFLFIYLKRYLTIYILALSASFMGVKYAIDRMLGKKTTSLNKWFKDFAFNVLLQTVHAFIYILFMSAALSVSQKSIGGALIAFMILNFMLKADSIIIKIFGLDKAGSLADVNQPESWKSVLHKFMPMYTITRGAINLGRGALFGDRGLISRARYWTTGKDTIADAKKVLEQKKYNKIGEWARLIDRTPIRHLLRYNQYKKRLGNNLSLDTNKRYYADIKQAKQMKRQNFTRKVTAFKDFTLGTAGRVAGLAVAIADPTLGLTMYAGAKRTLKKYRTPTKKQYRMDVYGGTYIKAKHEKDKAKFEYDRALNKYTNNQFAYEEEYNRLLDEYQLTAEGSTQRNEVKERIRILRANRKKEKAKEIHELQEADENLTEANVNYGNAKHEKNARSLPGKIKNKFVQGIGNVSGVTALEDMAKNDTRKAFDNWDANSKQQSKLKDMAKVADLEKEFRTKVKELKQKYTEVAGITEAEAKRMFENDMSNIAKEGRKQNISSGQILRAVNEYLYENNKNKVAESDIDGVLDKLQEVFNQAHKNITITPEIKDEVRKAVEKKMIADNKGLGFDVKDSTTAIREAFGKDGVLSTNFNISVNNTDPRYSEIEQLHKDILQKLKDINTYDQIGKVKYKDSLITMKKIIKDARK